MLKQSLARKTTLDIKRIYGQLSLARLYLCMLLYLYKYILIYTYIPKVQYMNTKKPTSQILISLPKEQHRRLKMRAAALGTSMRQVVLEALEALDICDMSSHYPNEETQKVLKEKKKL